MRKFGRLTSASISASAELPTDQPMLDCPAQSHTSPMATSSTLMVFEPVIFSECPVPNAGVSKSTFHAPSAPACAEAVAPQLAVTVMDTFGSAHPQIVFFMFC